MPTDEVISALQREVERGHTEEVWRLAIKITGISLELEENFGGV